MENIEEKTFYELLGVERSASSEEIREAYKEIARVYHPDSNYYQDLVEYEPSVDQIDVFKAITAAYHTLSNREKRAAYDKTLAPDLKGWSDDPGYTNEDAQIEEYLAKLGVDPRSIGLAQPKKPNKPRPRERKNSAAYGIFGTAHETGEGEANVIAPQFSSTAFSHGDFGIVRPKRPTLTGVLRSSLIDPEQLEPVKKRSGSSSSLNKHVVQADEEQNADRTRMMLFFFGGLSVFVFAASVVTFILIG